MFRSAEDLFETYKNEGNDLTSLFEHFRQRLDIFHFIGGGDDNEPSDLPISISKGINSELYEKYVSNCKTQKLLGYGDRSPTYGDYNNLDCFHIMMSVVVFHTIKGRLPHIVEIGGGYGNWLRLNSGVQDFDTWYIVDLPYINLLQDWYLSNQGVERTKYQLLSCCDYSALDAVDIDLVIAAHSLSEFSFDVFSEYFEKVVSRSKYFFYSYHIYLPDENLVRMKMDVILTKFSLVVNVLSQEGVVSNCVFVRL